MPTSEYLAVTVPDEDAAAMMKDVVANLASGGANGMVAVFVTPQGDGTAGAMRVYNVSGSDVMRAAIAMISFYTQTMRTCCCPQDHTEEMAAIDAITNSLVELTGLNLRRPGSAGLH